MLAFAMLAGLIATIATPQSAWAGVGSYRPATYNMQGGGGGGANKWTTDIPRILREGYNVVALQEAGPIPPGRFNGMTPLLGEHENWSGWTVQEYVWRPPGQTTDWYIYYMRTDFGGNRVNLAFLSHEQAHDIRCVLPIRWGNNGLPQTRPVLGITLGNTRFYTVHAAASRNNESPELVQAIAADAHDHPWAAIGDWNMDPNVLPIVRGQHRYTTGEATQQSGGELDYMVTNERMAGYGGVRIGMASDHYAIGFRGIAAEAGVQLLNAHDDNHSVGVTSKAWGIQVLSGAAKEYTHWVFKAMGSGFYSIYNRSTGLCWSDNAGRVIQWGCNGATDQLFKPGYWNDTGQLSLQPKGKSTCVGDDNVFGWGSQILTTRNCRGGESRWNFKFDYEPGPFAKLLLVVAS
ncbi:endonuclease/exonuclease/phosphatase family protein [Streptomyces sp. NPDC006872]|uniref:endonuclease/exonuclease/phosphatase family protein n=1 Tax=Streptomyces sp. NPDC006872 TaxID=3155720 RepID=UPI0033C583FB